MDRKNILKTYNDLIKERKDLFTVIYEDDSDEHKNHLNNLNERIADTNLAYLKVLPVHTVSRCPYTGGLTKYKIDSEGFGPWWDYDNPMRDAVDGPATFFGLDGAMKVEVVEDTDITVFPGPDKPFVIKDLLNRHEIKAVISTMTLASNTVWIITYYSYPIALSDCPNLYASDRFFVKLSTSGEVAYSSNYTEKDYDFNLMEWIKKGKLLWIAPGDETFKLKSTLIGCPYLNMKGKGKLQMIQDHAVTFYTEIVGRRGEDE